MSDLPRTCPKCSADSGDDWTQCHKQCPMEMSPHYDRIAALEAENAKLREALAKGCMTMVSHGPSRLHEISIKFQSMADMHDAGGLLVQLRDAALATTQEKTDDAKE